MAFLSSDADHPAHYGGKDHPHETIKVLESWLTPEEYIGFCKGNAIKYLSRHREKGGLADLEKATWYQLELVRFCKSKGVDPVAYVIVDQAQFENMLSELSRLRDEKERVAPPKRKVETPPPAPEIATPLLSEDDLTDVEARTGPDDLTGS